VPLMRMMVKAADEAGVTSGMKTSTCARDFSAARRRMVSSSGAGSHCESVRAAWNQAYRESDIVAAPIPKVILDPKGYFSQWQPLAFGDTAHRPKLGDRVCRCKPTCATNFYPLFRSRIVMLAGLMRLAKLVR